MFGSRVIDNSEPREQTYVIKSGRWPVQAQQRRAMHGSGTEWNASRARGRLNFWGSRAGMERTRRP